MTQSELIRFRLTTFEKAQIAAAAQRADISVSSLVRRAARAAAAGRPVSRDLLADLATIRRAANALASIAEGTEGLPLGVADHVMMAANELRRIAVRHLEAQR